MPFYATRKLIEYTNGAIGKTVVQAYRFPENGIYQFPEFTIQGKKGSWLVEFPTKKLVIVNNSHFRKLFEPIKDEKGMAYALRPDLATAAAADGKGRWIDPNMGKA